MLRRGLLALLATLSLFPAVALASRAPSRSERGSIVAAIHRMKPLGNPLLYLVKNIRVSTRGPYARASTAPRDRAAYQGALLILRRTHAVWRVIDFGSAGVGCSLPPAVQLDLHVTPPTSYCAQRG